MTRSPKYMKRASGVGAHSDHPPVVVSHEGAPEEDVSINDLDGHLRVSTERTYHIEVPYDVSFEGPKRFTAMSNPINQCGPLLSQQVPVVTGSDFDSYMAAFNKRANTLHVDDIGDEEFSAAYELLDRMIPKFPTWDDNELDRSRWMSKFDAPKRARMEEAMLTVPDCSLKFLGTKDLSVKHEVLLKRNDPKWAPRLIYAGNDAFNAVTGPAMMVAMERFDAYCRDHDIGPVRFCTAYKRTDVQLAEFITADRSCYPYVVEGDYSANDKEQRKRVHLLFDFLLVKLGLPSWLRRVFTTGNDFRVQSRAFGMQAQLKNQLPTGTTATTVRNSMYNALMFSVACSRQGLKARALILGDDLLAVTSKSMNLRTWTSDVAKFKMVLKAKSPRLEGQATFLSKRIIVQGGIPCMVPLLGKAIARFNARAIYTDNKSSSQYMAGKSLSYAYEFRHVPFMRDFFLQRYVLEDRSRLDLDDLTWTTKVSGIDLDNIVQAIKDEVVIVSDDDFRDWSISTYDLGLCDLEDICETVLCSSELEMIDHPAVPCLSMDWA